MALSLAMHFFLALLLSLVYFHFGRTDSITAETDLQMNLSRPFSPEDIKFVSEEINDSIKTEEKWEVVCENEDLSLKCYDGEVINIMDAMFGRNDRTTCASYPTFSASNCLYRSNVLYTVKQRCHNKRRCNMKSSNAEFGDPCPYIVKFLKVKYSCEPVHTAIRKSETACEGNSINLSCQDGESILITDALYGRNDRTTCCCRFMDNTECQAKYALEQVSARCDYNRECNLPATNDVFGDPCIGTIKYLTVDYLCLKNTVFHARSCESTEVKLECKSNSSIDVIDAFYGRAHPFLCLNRIEPFLKDGCGTKDIKSWVKERCQGRSSCVFPASNELFGDPCIGYTKYLDVEYICKDIV